MVVFLEVSAEAVSVVLVTVALYNGGNGSTGGNEMYYRVLESLLNFSMSLGSSLVVEEDTGTTARPDPGASALLPYATNVVESVLKPVRSSKLYAS